MEPIKLEFIVKGDIEKELAKVQLAVKGVGDESYTSFKRLLGSSNEAFGDMSRMAQLQAVSLQQVIQQLRQNEVAQEALYEKFKKGSLSSREYAQAQSRLSVQQAELKQQASELSRSVEYEIRLNKTAKGSLEEKKIILARLREEYTKLNKEESENVKIGGQLLSRIRELNREVKNAGAELNDTKNASSDLTDVLEMIPGPIGSGVSQFRQLLSVGKTFMSSGIGLFVAGLASTFFLLKTAIEGSEEGTVRLTAKLEYFKSIYSTNKKILTQGAAAIYNLFSGNTQAMQKNLVMLTLLQAGQSSYASAAEEAAVRQNEINKQEERRKGLILANSSAIEQYRMQLMDVNKTFEERKKIGQEILRLEKENTNLKFTSLSDNYENFKEKSLSGYQFVLGLFPGQIKLAEKYFDVLTQGGELSLTQQHELINAINDITSGLDSAWDNEQKAEFRSYFTDALTVTKDYYNKSREVSVNLSNIIRQQADAVAKENRKTALESLQEEVKLRKEQYAILYAYERNMGKEAADRAFQDLKAEGDDFIGYLSNKIKELQGKTSRTKEEDINLGWLLKERKESLPKFDTSAFRKSIEDKKSLYRKDLEGYAAYLEKMRELIAQDTSDDAEKKRIILDLQITDVRKEQQRNLNELLKNYQGFVGKMASLEKDYKQDMALLSKTAQSAITQQEKDRYQEAMRERTNAYRLQLAALTADNSEFAQVLFSDLEKISRSALKKAIAEAKKFIQEWKKTAGELTPDMKALLDNIERGINDAEKAVKNGLVNDFQSVANSLEECATMAEAFDSSLSEVIQTASDVAQAASSIAAGIAQIGMGNYVQGASGILSGITGFVTGIGKRLEENKKIREAYLQNIVETYSKELEYNAILRERLRLQQQIGETTLEYSARMEKELQSQQSAIQREYDEVYGKLMGENYISGQHYRHGTWFRKAKTWNEYSSLSGKTYEEIESLYTQDKLDGAAKTLFERLKSLKEEGAGVVEMMEDLKQEMREAWTNTTSSAITDSIIQGFLNGKRSAADFADDFRNLMREAMMQSIKMKYLEAPLQEWYENFAAASEIGLTADKIEELRKQYNSIIDNASREAQALEKVTGVSMTQDATRTAVEKGIQSVSQDSFDEFLGSVNALQYITYNIGKDITDIQSLLYRVAAKWIEIEENTRYCRKLESIEKDIREMKNGIGLIANKGVIIRTGR